MLTANELRIGNWVNIAGTDYQVTGIYRRDGFDRVKIQNCDYTGPDSDFEPIPFTEEWLLKFGFENGKILIGLTEIAVRKFQTAWQGVFDGEYSLTLLDSALPHQLKNNLKYVHQLQNLVFAITGKELEIKQPAPSHNQ